MQKSHEYAGNMHMHTPYSDGEATHEEIAQAAGEAGLDFVIVTDHNVWVDGIEGYYGSPTGKQVLVLVGEEIHDRRREPQANHLLVYGAEQELAAYASDSQRLIDEVKNSNGFCYLAHPCEVAAPLFDEGALSWEDWDVSGYTGLELWNYMSEFKQYLPSKASAVRAALNPQKVISGPSAETLALWDRLLSEGQEVKIIGNSDAHGTVYSMGPVSREIFPYEFLFRCVNTHIMTNRPMTGDFEHDKKLVLRALRDGNAFVGYDLPHSTRGFRFSAQGHNKVVGMGEKITLGHGVTLQMASPVVADMCLLKDGKVIEREVEGTHRTFIARDPGVYRVEVYIEFEGKPRGWVYSNPIFVID